MLTKKLLAAVGLAGALLLGYAAPAEAQGFGRGQMHHGRVYWGPARGPGYGGPVYRGPIYRHGGDWRRAEWRREHARFGYRY